jgi:antitoxin VapB
MKRPSTHSSKRGKAAGRTGRPTQALAGRRAAIFRNGRNQAVRLPQDLRFPEKVREVQVQKQGENILLSPIRPDWTSFFALDVSVPDNFLLVRDDTPPQEREPL